MKKVQFIVAIGLMFISIDVFGGNKEVRNVIFMIGDGMGLSQVSAAMLMSDHTISIERAQYIGLIKTSSADNRVTDSAAAGTALATGVKTNNGSIGVDRDNNEVANLVERASAAKMGTGIVVSCDVTHATPAAFYAHAKNRNDADEIADDMYASSLDVVIGGGLNRFKNEEKKIDKFVELRKNNFQIVTSIDEASKIKTGKMVALLAPEHLPKAMDSNQDYLPRATSYALDLLANDYPKGFFMMVEGSQIDWAGHENKLDYLISEMSEFERAVGVAFDFADRHPGTLVIVTADHETGGLSLPSGNVNFNLKDQGLAPNFGSTGHTATMIPVYTYGAGAENFSVIMENTDLPKKIGKLLNLK